VRSATDVHEIVVVRRAIDARVLRHRRDDDAILQGHARRVNGVNIGGTGFGGRCDRAAYQLSNPRQSRDLAGADFRCEMRWLRSTSCTRTARRRMPCRRSTFSNHSVELRAAFWIFSTRCCARLRSPRAPCAYRTCDAARRKEQLRPRARAWCPSPQRNALCARHRP